MKTEQQSRKLNRYTTLPVLLDLLRRKKIVLLDPSTWEDRNDAEIILEYKKRKKIPKLFAVCFGIGDETIHHWKTYANGISGCCIEFDEKKLLTSFQGIKEVRWGDVTYKKINEAKENTIKVNRIPFVKRWPYRCENEFRILWEGETSQNTIDIDIDLNSINKITLSQKMPDDVSTSIKELLREEIRDPSRKINRSTLYENSRWIKAFKK
jgi:hypothetical protein